MPICRTNFFQQNVKLCPLVKLKFYRTDIRGMVLHAEVFQLFKLGELDTPHLINLLYVEQ